MLVNKVSLSSLVVASVLFSGLCGQSFGSETGIAISTEKPWPRHIVDNSSSGADGVKLADVNNNGLLDITTGWEEGSITKIYLHPGHAKAKLKWPTATVGKTPSVEDAVFVDLDNDGCTDVVSCCEGATRTMFIHWAPRDKNQYMQSHWWKQEAIPASKDRMMWMFAIPMQVDGKNGVDLIAAGKGTDAQIGWFEAPKNPRSLEEYEWHAITTARWIMSLILYDMDGDGDLDVVTSDRKGSMRGCRWLENPSINSNQTENWSNHFIGAREVEVMFMTVADLDQDGLQDVVVAAKEADVRYFRRLDKFGRSWGEQKIPYPDNTGTAKAVAVGDINKDGRLDIVFSCEHAYPPRSGVMWLSYTNKISDRKWSAHEISGPLGIKFDRIELIDMDGDGDLDVLTCEERHETKGLGVLWYENPHAK